MNSEFLLRKTCIVSIFLHRTQKNYDSSNATIYEPSNDPPTNNLSSAVLHENPFRLSIDSPFKTIADDFNADFCGFEP